MTSALRIVILGYIVRGPLGGLVWHHLQYVLGLHRMGHDVLFLEDSEDYAACYDPDDNVMTTDPGYGLRFIQDVFSRYGLEAKWAYFDQHTQTWHGRTAAEVESFCRSSDILLNLSGVNPLPDFVFDIPARLFIDTDPVFTQVRHLTDPQALRRAKQHTHFFTFGENFGRPGCRIPDDGLPWQPTRQPVVPDVWPVVPGDASAPWSTILQWDSYREAVWQDQHFGMKSASFDAYGALPVRSGETIELAIGSATAPRDRLTQDGWILRDPLAITRTPWTYQTFIRQSKAEWSIAKHGYVVSRSGWFSERSLAYLASGRPVLVQDTGFSDWLETGAGILTFNDMEECLAGMQDICQQYEYHQQQARRRVETEFKASKVLNHLLRCL